MCNWASPTYACKYQMCTHRHLTCTRAHADNKYFTALMILGHRFIFKSRLSLVEFYILIARKRCSFMLFSCTLVFSWSSKQSAKAKMAQSFKEVGVMYGKEKILINLYPSTILTALPFI